MSIQKARDYRERKARENVVPSLPERPDDARLGIVFLYAACCVALVFLIITGDVQWREAALANERPITVALVQMGVTGVLGGVLGFALSRNFLLAQWILYVVVAVGAGVLAFVGAELFVLSSGLFVCDLLSLLMELAAVFFLNRPSSRAWFAEVRAIQGSLFAPLFGGRRKGAVVAETSDAEKGNG